MPLARMPMRSSDRKGLGRTLWSLFQAFPLLLALVALGADARAQGTWDSYDWGCDTANLTTTDARVKMIHGALIAHGPYRGCVLTWGKYQDTTRTFLWDPANPSRLFHVVNTWAGADRDMNGASMTWDDEGQLVVIGATPSTGSPGSVSETWRVFPGSLGYPPLQTVPGTACVNQAATVGGNAWRAAPSMSVFRHRPTLLAMAKGSLGTSAVSASTFALGGLTSSVVNDGWEFWQALSPRSTPGGSTWGATLIPNITHPHTDPVPNQQYIVLTGLTETQLEATPGAVQLADSGSQGNVYEKSILSALDSLVIYNTPPSLSNSIGAVRLVRPGYAASTLSWEYSNVTSMGTDRSQGSVILRHDRSGAPGSSLTGKNRVMTIGGLHFNSQSQAWIVPDVVTEYEIAPATRPDSGVWHQHLFPMGSPHTPVGTVDNSAVVLPTGDIFVVGGGRLPAGGGVVLNGLTPTTLPLTPNNQPQLVTPGRAGGPISDWSAIDTAPAPVSPIQLSVAPRMHGHAAVLLADGRVLVTGGDMSQVGSPALSFTGDIFSPPYLSFGFRPSITNLQGSTFLFGQTFELTVSHDEPETVDSVVLLRPASTAFGVDTSQRYIELDFTGPPWDVASGMRTLTVTAPAEDLGPPGYYMLFVVAHLNANPVKRVPSVGQFIYLN